MSNVTLKGSGWRWLWLAVVVFILDIGSKLWVMDNIGYGWENRIEVFSFFNLLYVHNYGAAFSFLSNAGGWQRWFFTGIAFVITALLLYWMRKTPASSKMLNIAYSLIIGGALGNVFDRIMHGYVVDFLDFHVAGHHWPAFNIADMAICVGAALIILESIIFAKNPLENPKDN